MDEINKSATTSLKTKHHGSNLRRLLEMFLHRPISDDPPIQGHVYDQDIIKDWKIPWERHKMASSLKCRAKLPGACLSWAPGAHTAAMCGPCWQSFAARASMGAHQHSVSFIQSPGSQFLEESDLYCLHRPCYQQLGQHSHRRKDRYVTAHFSLCSVDRPTGPVSRRRLRVKKS